MVISFSVMSGPVNIASRRRANSFNGRGAVANQIGAAVLKIQIRSEVFRTPVEAAV